MLCLAFANVNPLPLVCTIGYGYERFGQNPLRFSAKGWVFTFGLNGKVTTEENCYGRMRIPPINLSYMVDYDEISYVGAIGFSGLKISNRALFPRHLYLGSAILVHIGEDCPNF